MTELELMNAGELHHFWDDEINALAARAEKLVEKFNATSANDDETKNKIIKELPNVIAAGNPCRVIREINDEDKKYWEAKRDKYLKSKEAKD